MRVPRQRPGATAVPEHRSRLFALGHVPYLHLAAVRADAQIRPTLRPRHRGDGIVRSELTQLGHLASARAPQVDARSQTDG